jgi:hypothetical protein
MAGVNTALSRNGYTHPRKLYWNPDRVSGRKKAPEMRKSFQLAELHEKHHEIARRIVVGHKPKEIAKDLGLNYHTVISIKNSPIVQEQIKLLSGARDSDTLDVAKQIRNLAPKCVEVLENILEDEETTQSLKMKASLAILDRAGHSVPKNVNMKSVHAVLSPNDLAVIKERALEIGLDSGVVDIEPD